MGELTRARETLVEMSGGGGRPELRESYNKTSGPPATELDAWQGGELV